MKKLVRDKIPAIIEASGRKAKFEEFSNADVRYYVRRKLDEELIEVLKAKTKADIAEELGDLLQVMEKYAEVNKIEWADVLEAKKEKAKKAGAFKKNVVLSL